MIFLTLDMTDTNQHNFRFSGADEVENRDHGKKKSRARKTGM